MIMQSGLGTSVRTALTARAIIWLDSTIQLARKLCGRLGGMGDVHAAAPDKMVRA